MAKTQWTAERKAKHSKAMKHVWAAKKAAQEPSMLPVQSIPLSAIPAKRPRPQPVILELDHAPTNRYQLAVAVVDLLRAILGPNKRGG